MINWAIGDPRPKESVLINAEDLETGDFHDISGYGIAVNYPLEYREIGFNEKLVQVIEENPRRVKPVEPEIEGEKLI